MLKNISLLLSTVFITIMLSELFIRLFSPQNLIYYNNDIWRPDSLYGWRHFENADAKINAGGAGVVNFYSDSNGFRISKNINEHSVQYDYKVLALGDSYLEALQVENKNTVTEKIKSKISSRFDIEFYNSGVGGWSPNHYLIQARSFLEKNDVDLGIVFFYIGNDVVKKKVEKFSPKQPHIVRKLKIPEDLTFHSFKYGIFYPINDYLEVRSHLFLFLKNRLSGLLMKLGLTAYYFPWNFFKNEEKSKAWGITVDVCKEIQKEFNKYNIPLFFVFIPVQLQFDEGIFNKYLENFDISEDEVDINQPQKILKELFQKYEIPYYDPYDYMRMKSDRDNMNLYGAVDNHFNINGHEVLSEFLFPIVENALVKKN